MAGGEKGERKGGRAWGGGGGRCLESEGLARRVLTPRSTASQTRLQSPAENRRLPLQASGRPGSQRDQTPPWSEWGLGGGEGPALLRGEGRRHSREGARGAVPAGGRKAARMAVGGMLRAAPSPDRSLRVSHRRVGQEVKEGEFQARGTGAGRDSWAKQAPCCQPGKAALELRTGPCRAGRHQSPAPVMRAPAGGRPPGPRAICCAATGGGGWPWAEERAPDGRPSGASAGRLGCRSAPRGEAAPPLRRAAHNPRTQTLHRTGRRHKLSSFFGWGVGWWRVKQAVPPPHGILVPTVPENSTPQKARWFGATPRAAPRVFVHIA